MKTSPARRRAAIVAAVLAAFVLVFLFRDAILGGIVARVVSNATGYDVAFGSLRLGANHGVATDVHVTKNGDPVIDATRVDLDYALRDIFPGGSHRLGFVSLAIVKPILTIVRHKDGFSFNRGGTAAAPPSSTKRAAAPYYFTARIRNGTIRLIDQAPLSPDLANQTIEDVSLDATVKTDARTNAKIDGVLVGRRAAGAPMARWPLSIRSLIDRDRGIAINRVRAGALPLRGALGFFLHTAAARFDDGVVRDVDVRAYAVDIPKDGVFAYRYGGVMHLEGGRIAIGALAKPIRDLHGVLDVADDALVTPRLDGEAAGAPVTLRGGIYGLLGEPRFWMAARAGAELRSARTLFAFSAQQPIDGTANVETLLAATVAKPLVRTYLTSPRATYATFPVAGLEAFVDAYDDAIVIHGGHARYGGLDVRLGGRIVTADRDVPLDVAAFAHGPGAELPYAQLIAGDAFVDAAALIGGNSRDGYTARGAIAAAGNTEGTGFFAVDAKGRGEFGPFAFARTDGSSFAGALRLERPISSSAGWISVRNYRVAPPLLAAALPGVPPPALPPLGGIVDGDLAGGGSPDVFGVGGHVRARDVTLAGRLLGNARVDVDGTLAALQLRDLHVDGPLGTFDGEGAASDGAVALRGRYDGRLEPLAAVGGLTKVYGGIHGPVAVSVANDRVVVQTDGATLNGASVQGVRVDGARGTVAIDMRTSRVDVIAADATLGGARAVAAQTTAGGFLVSAPEIPAAAVRDAGFPLDAGALSLFGIASLAGKTPSFDGSVLVQNGRVAGIPVGGDANLALGNGAMQIRGGTASVGSTYASVAGAVDNVGGGVPSYDLLARVPVGDVGTLRRDLHLPLRDLDGSFDATARVRGSGARPSVSGSVDAPEGVYHGLAFRNGHALVDATARRIDARDGRLTVGSTQADVDASVGWNGAFAVHAASAHADLADFNDYFDQADVLAGKGRIAAALANDGRRTATSGALDVRGMRILRFPPGDVRGSWSTLGDRVRTDLAVNGTSGSARVSGTLLPASGPDVVGAFLHAAYDERVSATGVALGAWLPGFGVSMPILGTVDASGTVRGRAPRLVVDGDATLHDGVVAGYKIASAHLRTRGSGDRIALEDASADLGFVQLAATGTLGLGPRDPLTLRVHAHAADVNLAMRRILPQTHLDVAGSFDADMIAGGTFAAPRLDAAFDLENGRYETLAVPRILGSASYEHDRLSVREAQFTFTRGSALVVGALPLRLQPFGIGAPTAPLSFDVTMRGLDLAPFSGLVPGAAKLGGTADGHLGVEGTVANPRLFGTAAIAGGSYVSKIEVAPIKNVDARLTFSGTTVALEALHANVGGGTLDGSGRLDLPFPNAPRTGYAIDLVARGDVLDFPQYGRGRVDGELKLVSGAPLPTLSGDVTLSDAVIPFAAIYSGSGGGGGAGGAAGGPPFDLAFNVMARAAKNVRVRSSFLDVGGSGSLALTGTLSAPRLAGTVTATPGGIFTTYNHLFRVQSATVSFDPSQGIVPTLDLRATARVINPDPDPTRNAIGSADITVTVQGPADAVTSGSGIEFTSNPPYSKDQIVALLADVPALLGAVNFGTSAPGAGYLPGAPVPENPLLPPGVTTTQTAQLSFNQEAFSIFSGQLAQRFFGPFERFFGGAFGLTDFELTLDYGGGVGYNARKQLGGKEVYANFGQTLSYPARTQFGIEARPNPLTAVIFSYYQQAGVPAFTTRTGGLATTSDQARLLRLKGVQPLDNRRALNLSITRRF